MKELAATGENALYFPLLTDRRLNPMSQGTVQLIAGLLCVALIGIIIVRRKGKKKSADDDF